MAQSGSAPALGAGCRGFKSLCPDQFVGTVRLSLCPGPLVNDLDEQYDHSVVSRCFRPRCMMMRGTRTVSFGFDWGVGQLK